MLSPCPFYVCDYVLQSPHGQQLCSLTPLRYPRPGSLLGTLKYDWLAND